MTATEAECTACRKLKSLVDCALCGDAVCKGCRQVLATDAFAFQDPLDEKLKHVYYCGPCYDAEVAPELDQYQEALARAKEVFIFFTTQRKEIPLIRRANRGYKVESCPDRDETILRLAFFAARDGYNAVIEVEANCKKLRNAGHQTSDWYGSGVPAQVDEAKLDRQHKQNQIYR